MLHACMRRESGRALLRGLDDGWAGLQSNYQRSKQAGTCPSSRQGYHPPRSNSIAGLRCKDAPSRG